MPSQPKNRTWNQPGCRFGTRFALTARLALNANMVADTAVRPCTAALVDTLINHCQRQEFVTKRPRAVLTAFVRSPSFICRGALCAAVDLDGTRIVICERTRVRAETEAGGAEGKSARPEARLQAMRDVVRPGIKVRVKTSEVDSSVQAVGAAICHIGGA